MKIYHQIHFWKFSLKLIIISSKKKIFRSLIQKISTCQRYFKQMQSRHTVNHPIHQCLYETEYEMSRSARFLKNIMYIMYVPARLQPAWNTLLVYMWLHKHLLISIGFCKNRNLIKWAACNLSFHFFNCFGFLPKSRGQGKEGSAADEAGIYHTIQEQGFLYLGNSQK